MNTKASGRTMVTQVWVWAAILTMNISAANDATPHAAPETAAATQATASKPADKEQANSPRMDIPLPVEKNTPALECALKIEDADKPQMVLIKGGTFRMGGQFVQKMSMFEPVKNEQPYREVKVDSFYISRFETPIGLWRRVVAEAAKQKLQINAGISDVGDKVKAPSDDPRYSVGNITFEDMMKWCNALSEMEGRKPCYYAEKEKKTPFGKGKTTVKPSEYTSEFVDWTADGYRLPTEAEWEYACRAGTTTEFFTGEKWDPDYGWSIAHNTTLTMRMPGLKKPNPWGLYDMAGNKFEVCWDWYAHKYDPADTDNPKGPLTGEPFKYEPFKELQVRRVMRSGLINFMGVRPASRIIFPHTSFRVTFRFVRKAEAAPTNLKDTR